MRVTCDLDNKSQTKLKMVCLKGRIFCHKQPDFIHKTRRGYHIIWLDVRDFKGNPITEERALKIREKIGDDKNRISLDSHSRRLHQVLFKEKTIRHLNEGYIEKEETFIRRPLE